MNRPLVRVPPAGTYLPVSPLSQDVRSLRMPRRTSAPRSKTVIGWVELVSLPGLSNKRVEAKVDTGAETCALHATNITIAGRYVSFKALGRSHRLRLKELRSVRSSNGSEALRPVVDLLLRFAGRDETVEFTLTNRDGMKFPILLGRNYLKDGFLVDVGFRFVLASPAPRRRKR